MTIDDLTQYDALSESLKREYIALKSAHPDWNHKQIMLKIALKNTYSGDIQCGELEEDDESLWDKLKNIFR